MAGKRPLARCFQPITLIAARQRDDAHGGAVTLLRMRPCPHHPFHQDGGVGTDPRCPLDQACRRHVGIALVSLRHVFIHRDMSRALRTAHMGRDAPMSVEDLDHPMGQPDLDAAADQWCGTE